MTKKMAPLLQCGGAIFLFRKGLDVLPDQSQPTGMRILRCSIVLPAAA